MITDLYLLRDISKRLLFSFEEIGAHFLLRYLASHLIFNLLLKEAGFKRKLLSLPSPTIALAPMPQDL